MPLVEIKDCNALIDNKPFSEQPTKNKQEAYEYVMSMQQKTDKVTCIIKNTIKLLA